MTTCAGLIAIWWKRKGRKLSPAAHDRGGAKHVDSTDIVPLTKLKPRSLIAHLLRHSEPCREFVASQCDLYRERIAGEVIHGSLGCAISK